LGRAPTLGRPYDEIRPCTTLVAEAGKIDFLKNPRSEIRTQSLPRDEINFPTGQIVEKKAAGLSRSYALWPGAKSTSGSTSLSTCCASRANKPNNPQRSMPNLG
jgi:hypothetical protein